MAEIELKIFCNCGEELNYETTNYAQNCVEIIVHSCESCRDKTERESYKNGHDVGYDDGISSVGG